ncbi:MAG TPA: hypothetical protein VIK35_08880 [Verrucomicrobiae bacterium]
MSYRDPLPEGCPPSEAREIKAERVVYRLVCANIPQLTDFQSQRMESPQAIFRVPECLVCGISVHTLQTDTERIRKLPRFRNSLVCRVRLQNGAGRMQQTFQPSHHTWWPLAAFDILSHCEVPV